MVKSVAQEIKFLDFCKVLDEIVAARKNASKYEKLRNFYEKYRTMGVKLKQADPSAETSFFPLLRLLLPQLERERSAYGLSRFSLRRVLAKIIGLAKDSEDFRKLGSEQYDFSEVAYNLLRRQFNTSKLLNLCEINDYLDLMARDKADNSNARRQEDTLLKLLQNTSPGEQKWILRIILKKMSVSIGETKILKLFHPDAPILLNNTNSLSTVCEKLDNPTANIIKVEITLFTPIRPMLSKRCDAKEFYKSMQDGKTFIVETKFDGERFQLHMEDDKFQYFSRNGYDFTKKFGESYILGLYTPLLQGVFDKKIKSIILDGEMMGWNKHKKEFGSKGMAFDVKNLTDTTVYQPCFCVFDILLLNGEILADKTLEERMKTLENLFTSRTGVILHSTRSKLHTKQEIIDCLNASMDRKEEGIVCKDPSSHYFPNDRNGGWWKVKSEYFSGVMSDLDVIIMGGFYGRGNVINGLIVGVAVSLNSTCKRYLSLAKITTGLNADEWVLLRKRLEPHWIKTVGNNYENIGLNFGRIKPDVWVSPNKSCIIQVRATELQKLPRSNTDFRTPYTLRFARIEMLRLDKPCNDCLTLTELEELASSGESVHKLYNKHLQLQDIEYEYKKTKRHKSRFINTTINVDETVSNILQGHEFYVISGTTEIKVEEIEKLIKENGGNVVKIEGSNTYCIIAGEKHLRFEYYKGSVDIVKLSWLQKVLDCRKLYPYLPEDMIYIAEKTKDRFLRDYDKYGDSYTVKTTRRDLEMTFANIKAKGDYICPIEAEIEDLHREMGYNKRICLFSGYEVYFDKYRELNNPSSALIYDSGMDELVLQFWGGNPIYALTPKANCVITKSSDIQERASEIERISGHCPLIEDASYLYNTTENYKNSQFCSTS